MIRVLRYPRGRVTSKFGPRVLRGVKGTHSGIDVSVEDDGVLAPFGGYSVTDTNCYGGLLVTLAGELEDGRAVSVTMGHLSQAWRGPIAEGEQWCVVGDSGMQSTGKHVHITVRLDGRVVDPLSLPHEFVDGFKPPRGTVLTSWKPFREKRLREDRSSSSS